MKIIFNNFLPPKGFKCVNLFGTLFARKGAEINMVTLNHEEIHTAQMKELLYVPFYIIYFLEWLYRLVFHTGTAYKGISFEREAYGNQGNMLYIYTRNPFAQWRASK